VKFGDLELGDSLARPGAGTPQAVRAVLVDYLAHTTGCTLCYLRARHQYDHITRFGTAKLEGHAFAVEFYAGKGLCNAHLSELERIFWGPGLAETLLDLFDWMPDPFDAHRASDDLLGALPLGRTQCKVCHELRQDEAGYLRELAFLLNDAEFRSLYERSRGFCLPHTAEVLWAIEGDEPRQFVLRTEAEHWKRLTHDLNELVRKAKPPLRSTQTDSERSSATRCIEKLVGRRGQEWPPERAPVRAAATTPPET
jgi:hypothetical protein